MKKISILFLSVYTGLSVSAQTVNIHFKNGTTINFHEDLIESIDFSEITPEPSLTAGEAVDLGLSVMWASCNLGASNPTESGGYYSWGETSEKSNYAERDYAYYDVSTTVYSKIGTHISGSEYDAASVNLGKGWRIPSYDQFCELETRCSWKWTSDNGVNGYLITGKNGNSIFLPASGLKESAYSHNKNKNGIYWCDLEDSDRFAYFYYISSSDKYLTSYYPKFYGLTIRPIISYDDYNGVTDFDDSAVTALVTAYYGGGSIMSNGNTILSGSKLNFYFKNGSSEPVTLTNIKLIDGNGTEGGNLLDSDAIVTAGDTQGYTITLSRNTISPKCRFTYRYNNHVYSVEAAYQSFNWTKSFMHELKAE